MKSYNFALCIDRRNPRQRRLTLRIPRHMIRRINTESLGVQLSRFLVVDLLLQTIDISAKEVPDTFKLPAEWVIFLNYPVQFSDLFPQLPILVLVQATWGAKFQLQWDFLASVF